LYSNDVCLEGPGWKEVEKMFEIFLEFIIYIKLENCFW
jgi:hypothetical protein